MTNHMLLSIADIASGRKQHFNYRACIVKGTVGTDTHSVLYTHQT